MLLLRLSLATSIVLFSACSEDKGESTYAKFAVENASTAALNAMGTYTPTVFGVKMIDVRIMTELDSTQNPAPVIWYNPECGSESTTSTEVDGKLFEYTQSPGCDITKVTKYFDFSRPTATVNAEINSQPNKVYPATYKYVSIGFCEGSTTDNVVFQADGMSESATGTSGSCGVKSAEAVPPIEIKEGETLTISLKYSIDGIVSDSGSGICWTSDDGATKRCLNMPTFEPSAAKTE
jgi:hypothetical protein